MGAVFQHQQSSDSHDSGLTTGTRGWVDGPLTGIKGGGPTTGVRLQAEAEGIIDAATSIETDWEIGPLEPVHVLNVPGLISEGERVSRGSGKACRFFCHFGLPPLHPHSSNVGSNSSS